MSGKNLFIWILGISLLAGCEEQFDWQLSNNVDDLLVVDAVITNENKNHTIRLTKTYKEQNQTPSPASGAFVVIFTEKDTIFTTETPAGSGLYFTDSMQAVIDKLYVLGIVYNGKQYHAYDIQEPVEPFDSLLDSRPVSEDLYTINFHDSGENPNYIEYDIDWRGVGSCTTPIDCQARQIYFDLKNIDVNNQFKPDQERVDFPAGAVIIRRKYSVSRRYKEYLRGMLSETAWRGGLFDAFPANASSNLSEGAVGFFAVSTVVMDTTIVVE